MNADYVPPVTQLVEENRKLREAVEVHRITLRDQFAMNALQGLLANPFDMEGSTENVIKHFAEISYEYADAMMFQRNIKENN